jgi:hypothetical protein
MLELAKASGRLPLRFRGFVQLGDARQVSGAWTRCWSCRSGAAESPRTTCYT